MCACVALLGTLCALAQADSERTLVMSAAPWEVDSQRAREVFVPIAAYLARATGASIRFQYAGDWYGYQQALRDDDYDIVFDAAHLVAYRLREHAHELLAKVPGRLAFVFYARENDADVIELSDLEGRRVCARRRPDEGTLRLLSLFEHPFRQPQLEAIADWTSIYYATASGRCRAGIAPLALYRLIGTPDTRVLHMTAFGPRAAFTAGRRVSEGLKRRLTAALISSDAVEATAPLRRRFAVETLVAAAADEYSGLDELVARNWALGR